MRGWNEGVRSLRRADTSMVPNSRSCPEFRVGAIHSGIVYPCPRQAGRSLFSQSDLARDIGGARSGDLEQMLSGTALEKTLVTGFVLNPAA
jgi:hypothetical protein